MTNNRNTRMNTLNNAGIDTGRFFNINFPEGLMPGAAISVIINENGQPVIVNDAAPQSYDDVAKQIIEDGYVRNTKLYRRWTTAQMFRMLNYKSYDCRETGYHGYLNRCLDYTYTLKMMMEEIRVLGKLEVRDRECFEERSSFFTKNVVGTVLRDYMKKLKKHVCRLPRKNCKGVPYVTIKGTHYFVEDVERKIYNPLNAQIERVLAARSYTEMYEHMRLFMKRMVKLPWNTKKSDVWVDAYKGNGSYYTAKNLIMFHGLKVCDQYGVWHDRDASMQLLELKRKEYRGEGWRLFAFMKKLIEDNGFNFDAAMQAIYN